ncbi:MAG: MarR family transcriptional regulator [Archangium sp.]|nr:MarR family transcriptional regulator [Archangium sp.]MDP3156674.1 MarR family transcriptional regulator [Archangium sp.]MDP3570615.1 MarR family transcriptional regulator [Archangium sp.]
MKEQPTFPLEGPLDFMQHLWELNHALERMSSQMDRTLGVTAQQRLFLRCIGKYPGMNATQLASVLHLDRGTVSVSLGRLIKKGLVTGRRQAGDQRRVALSLTAKGRVLDRPTAGTVEHSVAQLISKAGPPAVNRAKRVLRLLSEDLTRKLDR